jgi:hypothetical protein
MKLRCSLTLLRTVLPGLAVVVASLCSAQTPEPALATAPERFSPQQLDTLLHGQWRGMLAMRQPLLQGTPDDPADTSDMPVRVLITGGKARVFISDKGKEFEVMAGKLDLLPLGPNAIVSGWTVGTSDGVNPSWIESVGILLSAKTDDELVMEWRRAVNNIRTTGTVQRAYSVAFSGTLQRMSAAKVKGSK